MNTLKITKYKTFALAAVLTSAFVLGCASGDNKNRNMGAGIGAAGGALVGAIIGHQTGNREKGALIGAAIGGAGGAYWGSRMDKQAKELEKIAETKRTEQGLITKLKSDILFDSGKANLKPTAQNNLSEMGQIMKKYPENVLTVKGYTDSTGSATLNQTLSQNRAEAVKAQLIASGIPASTITAVGMGAQNPISDNTSANGRQANRRVEVEVTVDETKVPKQN